MQIADNRIMLDLDKDKTTGKRCKDMSKINSTDNQEIYDNDLELVIDDLVTQYLGTLRDPDIIYNINGNTFTGLIKYIHRHANITKNMYADIDQLNDLWEIYTELCYRFNQKPVIEEYSILLGCSRDTIYSWANGEYRANDICKKLSSSRPDTVKKWMEECRMGRYKSAAAGNVGGIFLCKAVDGMAETAPVQIEPDRHKSLEQIRQERGLELHENETQLPPPAPPEEPET